MTTALSKKTWIITSIALLLTALSLQGVIAAEEIEEEDIYLFSFELEELIELASGIIALSLFIITFIAYRRDGRMRYLFISIAFLLFAVKNFLNSSSLFIDEIEILGPLSVALELLVLLLFFYALIKKGD